MLASALFISLLKEEAPFPAQQCRLLYSSLNALTTKGYLETTVHDIVTLAHTSKSTFYKYYKNKEAILIHLFELVMERLIQKVENTLSSYPPTTERTFQAIKIFIDTCFTNREVARLLMVDTVGLCPALESKRLEGIHYFSGVFQRELSAYPEEEKWILSHAMVGAVYQIVVQSLQLENLPFTDRIAEVLEQMLSKILRDNSIQSE